MVVVEVLVVLKSTCTQVNLTSQVHTCMYMYKAVCVSTLEAKYKQTFAGHLT